MELKINEFIDLFNKDFNGNYNKCAKYLGINVSQLHKVINKKQNAGLVFLQRIIDYCNNQGMDYRRYISLPSPLTNVNTKSALSRQKGVQNHEYHFE